MPKDQSSGKPTRRRYREEVFVVSGLVGAAPAARNLGPTLMLVGAVLLAGCLWNQRRCRQQNRRILDVGPAPSGPDAMHPPVRWAVAVLESHGLRAVHWHEVDMGGDVVTAAHLLTPDGRCLFSLRSGRATKLYPVIASYVTPERVLATTPTVPFRSDDLVVQRVGSPDPVAMLDRHLDALAWCDTIGLTMTVFRDADVPAVIEHNWSKNRVILQSPGVTLRVWHALADARRLRRPLAEQPEALDRLQRWRDDQRARPRY
jgi:hypothetical protein